MTLAYLEQQWFRVRARDHMVDQGWENGIVLRGAARLCFMCHGVIRPRMLNWLSQKTRVRLRRHERSISCLPLFSDRMQKFLGARREVLVAMRFSICVWLSIAFLTAVPSLGMAERPNTWIGFEVLENADDSTIKPDQVVIKYVGPISFPMAENLQEIWQTIKGKYKVVVLDLDSPGGDLVHAEKVIAVLERMRSEVVLKTLVQQAQKCLSACVLVFVQGVERVAGGATAWMFHGACSQFSNAPVEEPTRRYVGVLRAAGVDDGFVCQLEAKGYLTRPGQFWISGYELFHTAKANVITRLLPNWQPEAPRSLPIDPQIRSR